MSTLSELQNRIDSLEAVLREKERTEAEAKAAALLAQEQTDAAKDIEARAAAAAAERETIRRGSWLNHLLGEAGADAVINFAELEKGIPATGFAPGSDESQFVFTGGPVAKEAEISTTTLGKALTALTRTI